MKMSDMPFGTVVEVMSGTDAEERFERLSISQAIWKGLDSDYFITVEDMDERDDVKIISLPYAVTLKLATWLDESYVKKFNPESLILEAAEVVAKERHGD